MQTRCCLHVTPSDVLVTLIIIDLVHVFQMNPLLQDLGPSFIGASVVGFRYDIWVHAYYRFIISSPTMNN